MSEDVRPICIFCHQHFVYDAGDYRAEGGILATRTAPACDDPRTAAFEGRHIEFWNSTREQRDARFGPPAVKPTPAEHAAGVAALSRRRVEPEPEPAAAPQMGFAL